MLATRLTRWWWHLDVSVELTRWWWHLDVSLELCLSNSVRTHTSHKMMIACRCVSRTHTFVASSKNNLWSPNKDFGRRNKRLRPEFRLTFQWFVAQIEYARPLKSASKLRISSFVPPSKILGGTIARFRTHDFTKELHTRVLNQAILTHFFSIISVSIVVWPDCRVLTHASSFVKSWVRNRAVFVRHTIPPMWEKAFARLTHGWLGKDLTKRHACSAVCYLR
jgi:hypothetical protein